MQMTKAQAIAELEHIYEILPLIAEAVKEEKKPINQYGKTSYFRDMYGQSMGTVNNRKEGIRREIRSGRYPESALIERFIDKAVYADSDSSVGGIQTRKGDSSGRGADGKC